jgi:NIMA (never in mitosis gene a)-related kinase
LIVFLGDGNCVKLGDFGLSKIIQSHDFASTYVGTPFYMSPEICKAEAYTLYSDIWALGCIIYEMCAREPPFNAKTHFELIQKIKLGRYPPIPAVYSDDLKNVIASCLQVVPSHRPDTAQLLNIPHVKMMRKEQEVVQLGQDLRDDRAKVLEEKRELIRLQQEYSRKMVEIEKMHQELDSSLRREWEVKARLEIDRQVKQQVGVETAKLQAQFEAEVNARVEKALANYPNRLSTSPKLAPRSNTPTMPMEQEDLFPTDTALGKPVVNMASTSTLGTDSEFASGTDLSSLSLDDIPDEPVQKPVAAKRPSRRAPLARAQTMFPTQVPPSPMDVQMGEPSPAPASPSLAGLSLSPRRNAPRKNIFAAAKDGAKKWEPELPPATPTHEEWQGEYFEDNDGAPEQPSPTRPRSTSNGTAKGDPLKPVQALPVAKPNQRLTSAPSLAPKPRPTSRETASRPTSTVPIVAASPARKTKSSFDPSSPTRRPAPPKPSSTSSSKSLDTGIRSKKGMLNNLPQAMKPTAASAARQETKFQPKRNTFVQGRTLVELQQARGIPVPSSPAKSSPAIWDPEIETDMPSPFIVRSKLSAKQAGSM